MLEDKKGGDGYVERNQEKLRRILWEYFPASMAGDIGALHIYLDQYLPSNFFFHFTSCRPHYGIIAVRCGQEVVDG